MNRFNDESDVLTMFVELLIKEKGLSALDEESKNKLREQLSEQIAFLINSRIFEALPQDKFIELNRSIGSNSATPQTIGDIVMEAGIDVEKITADTMREFRRKYTGK